MRVYLMRIIYFHQYFNTPDMSGGTRSFEMARRLVDKGHEVHIITAWRECDDRPKYFATIESGIKVHWIRVNYSNYFGYFKRIIAFFKFALLSAHMAKFINADIVFATSTPLTIALPGIYIAHRKKIPMIFEVRDLWPELPIAMGALKNPVSRYLAEKLELFAYNNSESIIALSPGMKAGVINKGYSPLNIAVIPNGSDVDMFTPKNCEDIDFRSRYKIPRNVPLLIYTGSFGLINGLGYMVKLADELMRLSSNVHILLIGDGAEFQKVVAMGAMAGVLNNNLFVEKAIPKKEIAYALSASTMASVLFIDKPEMRANSANKFFDALAAGKPVLVNFGGWIHNLINDHKCGLSMWGKSMPDIAKELTDRMNNDQWLIDAGLSARRLACNYFNRDLLALQFEQVLLKTLEGKSNLCSEIAPGQFE
jgi:glycosyltransferase involved in cell wall biosynthesis